MPHHCPTNLARRQTLGWLPGPLACSTPAPGSPPLCLLSGSSAAQAALRKGTGHGFPHAPLLHVTPTSRSGEARAPCSPPPGGCRPVPAHGTATIPYWAKARVRCSQPHSAHAQRQPRPRPPALPTPQASAAVARLQVAEGQMVFPNPPGKTWIPTRAQGPGPAASLRPSSALWSQEPSGKQCSLPGRPPALLSSSGLSFHLSSGPERQGLTGPQPTGSGPGPGPPDRCLRLLLPGRASPGVPRALARGWLAEKGPAALCGGESGGAHSLAGCGPHAAHTPGSDHRGSRRVAPRGRDVPGSRPPGTEWGSPFTAVTHPSAGWRAPERLRQMALVCIQSSGALQHRAKQVLRVRSWSKK